MNWDDACADVLKRIAQRQRLITEFQLALASLPTATGGPDGDYRPKSEAEGS